MRITVLGFTLAAALAAASAGAAPAPEIDLLWAVKIPMRDGVRLNATVFKPKGQAGPLPAIFTLTPYNSDTYYPRARYFAQNKSQCHGRYAQQQRPRVQGAFTTLQA